MALVAYDDSDMSDPDEDDTTTLNNSSHDIKEKVPDVVKSVEETTSIIGDSPDTSSTSIFKLLPPTRLKTSLEENDDEFLHKKAPQSSAVKPKAKITVPSLNDFKDVEHTIPSHKPRVTTGKKSGLLSMLPEPKNTVKATTKSLIPHVLTQNPKAVSLKTPHVAVTPSSSKTKGSKTPSSLTLAYSDDDSDNDEGTDFFSINKNHDIPLDDVPLEIDTVMAKSKPVIESAESKIQSYFKSSPVIEDTENGDTGAIVSNVDFERDHHYNGQGESSSSVNDIELDDEAIRQLCGSRGRRKKEEIQILNINQKEVLADAQEWMRRGLMDDTSKRASVKRRGNEPTMQQKRKHQITYLAHQAKANEAELQNQWANGRMSKRQTQSKYGF